MLRILLLPIRLLMRLPGACCWLWEVVTLQHTDVEADQSQRQLAALRKVFVRALVFDLVVGGILVAWWPTVMARALRVWVERQVAQCDLAMDLYSEATREVTDLAYKLSRPEALAKPHGGDKLMAMGEILDRLEANQKAMATAQETAHKAQAALPGRLWWWTPWVDPLTGTSFRADATRVQIANALYQDLRKSPEQRGWLLAVSQASRPKF